MTPKIQLLSVIIPTRGRSHKLSNLLRAIESLAGNTSTPFEVILVVDGDGLSPDADVSYPLKIIISEHIGAGPARNLGLAEASGDAVLFLNDDVIPQPGFFESHIQGLNDGHDAVLGESRWIEPEHPSAFDGFVNNSPAIFAQYGLVDGAMYDFRFGWTLNLSIRRALIDRIEVPFDEGIRPIYFEDIEFAYRCFGVEKKINYRPSACVIHDHCVSIGEYFAREVLLGMMSVVLFERHRMCYDELFMCTPTDHARMVGGALGLDVRDHRRLLDRFVSLSAEPMSSHDGLRQSELLYDLHLPIKRRAFRIGMLAMIERGVAWDQRVEQARELLVHDEVFGGHFPQKKA